MYLHFALGLFKMSDLDTLVEEMSAISAKWESIGKELGVNEYYLTVILTTYNTSPHECLREMFRRWLEEDSVYNIPSWGNIIGALKKVKESELADHLKAKYIPGKEVLTTKRPIGVESERKKHSACWQKKKKKKRRRRKH